MYCLDVLLFLQKFRKQVDGSSLKFTELILLEEGGDILRVVFFSFGLVLSQPLWMASTIVKNDHKMIKYVNPLY